TEIPGCRFKTHLCLLRACLIRAGASCTGSPGSRSPVSLPELPAGRAARIAPRSTRIAGPHVVGGAAGPLGVPIHEDGVEARAVAEMHVPTQREALVCRRL